MTPCIYLFTFPNGKQYVGQTKNYKIRMNSHRRFSQPNSKPKCSVILYKAFKKYGWDNVIKEIICTCEESELNENEEKYIALYNTIHPNGYNMNSGGNAPTYVSNTTRKKMSEKHNERYKNPEVINKLCIAQQKRYVEQPMTEETRTKISSSKTRYYQKNKFPEDIKAKISEKALERYEELGMSEEVRDKISTGHRINGENLPRLITMRVDGKSIKYRLRNHPLCVSKTFDDLESCIEYLDELNDKLEHDHILSEKLIKFDDTFKPDENGVIRRKIMQKIKA